MYSHRLRLCIEIIRPVRVNRRGVDVDDIRLLAANEIFDGDGIEYGIVGVGDFRAGVVQLIRMVMPPIAQRKRQVVCGGVRGIGGIRGGTFARPNGTQHSKPRGGNRAFAQESRFHYRRKKLEIRRDQSTTHYHAQCTE